MPTRTGNKQLEALLAEMVVPRFPGMTVSVEHSARWNRMSVTFRWTGFADLLPEERFHKLAQVLPDDFRASKLAGFVWLELAPKESVDAYLKYPRSEDVADREGAIHASLLETGYYDKLAEALGPSPDKSCPGDFSTTAEVLQACRKADAKIQDAKLLFIRQGAYCDCQVLLAVREALSGQHGGG